MADVVIGMAASHAPNLATPSLMTGVKEALYAVVKAGFAEARALREQARPDAIVIFSTDHFDHCFYNNLPRLYRWEPSSATPSSGGRSRSGWQSLAPGGCRTVWAC
jgi:hypothetical protein